MLAVKLKCSLPPFLSFGPLTSEPPLPRGALVECSCIIHNGGSNVIAAFALELDAEWESLPFVPLLGTVVATLAAGLAHCGGLILKLSP